MHSFFSHPGSYPDLKLRISRGGRQENPVKLLTSTTTSTKVMT